MEHVTWLQREESGKTVGRIFKMHLKFFGGLDGHSMWWTL